MESLVSARHTPCAGVTLDEFHFGLMPESRKLSLHCQHGGNFVAMRDVNRIIMSDGLLLGFDRQFRTIVVLAQMCQRDPTGSVASTATQ